MKHIHLSIPGTTAAVKHYVIPPSGCRIVGVKAVVNSTQTAGTASVKIGKAGATNVLYTADLGTTGANGIGKIAKGVLNASATDAERKQVFDNSVAIEITAQLVVAGQIGIIVAIDEYCATI